MINLRLLVCNKCLDAPTDQLRTIVLPPDPPPVYNARPEAYTLDETDWIVTEGGNQIIETEDGADLIKQIPNGDGQGFNAGDIATESGDGLVTQDGDPLILDIPNPDWTNPQ